MKDPIDVLCSTLEGNRSSNLLIVTGAGVSVASGLRTFRGTDKDAVWNKDVTELATSAFFDAHPSESWRWYLGRFDGILAALPNPAHLAVAALEHWQIAQGGDYLLVTQNIDGLHRRAKSSRMVEAHGRADRVRCSRDGCVHGAPRGSLAFCSADFMAFRRDPDVVNDVVNVPRCPACSAPLRPHVLWFDETYSGHEDYQIEKIIKAATTFDLALFVGTSFSVGLTTFLVDAAVERGCAALAIDPGDAPLPRYVQRLRAKAEEILPALTARLEDE